MALALAAFALVAASSTLLLARVGQLDRVLHRLEHASTDLVALAVAFEALSFGGYVVLTRLVTTLYPAQFKPAQIVHDVPILASE